MSQNAIIGDVSPVELPQTQVDEQQLTDEKNMAKFSKSKEFQKLKEHLERRIFFYQNYLPDGRPVTEAPTPDNWIAANTIIGEFKAVIDAYEQAAEVVNASQ